MNAHNKGRKEKVVASGRRKKMEEKETNFIVQGAGKQMEYSDWDIKGRLTKGLLNKA